MKAILLVGLGAFIGSVSRYKLGGLHIMDTRIVFRLSKLYGRDYNSRPPVSGIRGETCADGKPKSKVRLQSCYKQRIAPVRDTS